jgi:L-threonylcarbamoyladenylate synthase
LDTLVLKVDAENPQPDVIRRAADVLRAGGLVAFPTETVYGLGANALDPAAVGRIFEAKGRPATNPVIVHISGVGNLPQVPHAPPVSAASEVLNVAANWSETAARLAARFWPGPLTLVVPKADRVPSIVTAGGPTVAVRCPDHPVARALIREAGVPVAAPSANRSTELSPTRAEHVLKGLNGRIHLLLDGGPCRGGIESTVVDATGETPRVLRPGLIGVPMLEEVCGRVEIGAKIEGVARSPGQMAKHYSPRTPLRLIDGDDFVDDLLEAQAAGIRLGVLTFSWDGLNRLPRDPRQAAALLYDTLHQLDREGLDLILVEMPPDTSEWAAVRDRLTRAAASG